MTEGKFYFSAGNCAPVEFQMSGKGLSCKLGSPRTAAQAPLLKFLLPKGTQHPKACLLSHKSSPFTNY